MKITVGSGNGWFCLAAALLVLLAGIPELSAMTLAVGKCKPDAYPTIQQAIDAAPVGAKVQVCPGAYSEQVTITRAVSLQGIIDDSGAKVFVFPPANGLVVNASNAFGHPVSAQVLVQNSGGAVNISGLYVTSLGKKVASGDIAGIFYQNSPGTINGVAAWTHDDSGVGLGVGILLEGGEAKPSVTVENCIIAQASYAAIMTETGSKSNSDLAANIRNNFMLVGTFSNASGVLAAGGSTVTISNNSLTGSGQGYGIWIGPAAGSVSGNDITNTVIGIEALADAVSISANRLSYNTVSGIDLQTAAGLVKGNLVLNPSQVGIEFNCKANPNVRSNTINGAAVGLDHVPSGLNTSTNKIFLTGLARKAC